MEENVSGCFFSEHSVYENMHGTVTFDDCVNLDSRQIVIMVCCSYPCR